ncbi:hypothetical protein [Cryobacterium sp. Hz7]|uniref:hypothetical protein n=1 Tax=Cryobacterium sp. Hz7 TaxID=1259166 RepID=UPI00141BD1DA|nr:hypothetical protein [Cryobacterium sp. Hz7]
MDSISVRRSRGCRLSVIESRRASVSRCGGTGIRCPGVAVSPVMIPPIRLGRMGMPR